MRTLKAPVILLIIILMSGACMHKQSNLLPELALAESLMYDHPDSALHLLQTMPEPSENNQLQRATWALLMTQARYKSYIKQSDTLINLAYDYFITQEDAQRKAMVLYYKGALCNESKRIEEAQEWYLKACEEAENIEDYQLAHLIYSELGDLYLWRSFDEQAYSNYKKALHYAQLANYNRYICNSYCDLARTISAQAPKDSSTQRYTKSIQYYENAIYYAQQMNDSSQQSMLMNELAGIYTSIYDYEKALFYAQKALPLNTNRPLETYYLVLGDLYRHLNTVDSARFYLEKALSSSSIYTIRSAYQALYYLNRKNKQYDKATQYADSFFKYKDSIYRLNKSRDLIEMQTKYDQQKVINEKNQMQIEKDRTIRNILIALASVLCISALLIYIYQRRIILKERIIQQNEEKIKKDMLQVQENEAIIQRNNQRLEELTTQLKESENIQEQLEEQQKAIEEIQQQNNKLKQENNRLQTDVDNYSLSLNEKTKEVTLLTKVFKEKQLLKNRETFLTDLLIKKTPVLQKLKTTPKYIEILQWSEIKEAINHLFGNYTERLLQTVPTLTESEVQICCLIKINMSNSDMATQLGISPASVSKKKLRLKEHILQEIGTFGESHTLDLWLREL